ncbi:MAG: histidine phosphatase family protein [Actinobacteria bacterium]|nr:histidine phosphatase family protein [Actinomycetota bacterium]
MSRIYVVRHGEASWHAEDYDQLTEKGHAQARAVGAELAARGIRPDVVVSGTLRRHRETAAGLLEGAGWDHAVAEDDRWNELDADDIVRAHAPEHATMTAALAHFAGRGAAGDFDALFGEAMVRWFETGSGYLESYREFTQRVEDVLGALVSGLAPLGQAVVVTSGGVGNSIASQVLGGGAETWMRIFGTFPNTGIMRLSHSGERGLRLLSLGEISHLEQRPELLSER